MFYFAYGSNLLTTRLSARCPSVEPAGAAIATGYTLEFSKLSRLDGSGKATIRAGDGEVEGVLFHLADDDIPRLDAAEGVGKGYARLDRFVVMQGGQTFAAFTYIADHHAPDLRPFDWYLALILAGMAEHDLSVERRSALAAIPRDRDPQLDRPGRKVAIKALEAAGFANWRLLLG